MGRSRPLPHDGGAQGTGALAAPSRRLGEPAYGGPGFDVVERVQRTIERRKLLGGGEKVVVAFSGGPDSTCLLDVLARLSAKLDLELLVAHVDHGISERSQDVAARVTTAAAEAGFEVHTTRIPDLTGPNLQAKAREFRYGFLELVVKKESADAIATGHTLDDRVETTLARLIHGAGLTGLAGLPAKDRDRVRPLVDLRRSETRAYLEECGIESYDDPANDDDSFERVAVRDRLLSAIEKRWGDGAIRAMTVSADRLRDDADALDSIAERLYGDSAKTSEEGVSFDRGPLMAIPRAFRRRLLERAVGHVRDRSGGIGAALDALDAGLPGPGSPSELRFAVASGIEIVIASDRVIVTGSG